MHDVRETERLPSTPKPTITTPDRSGAFSAAEHTGFAWPSSREADTSAGHPATVVAARKKRSRAGRWLLSAFVFVALAVPLALFCILGAVYWQARTDEARPVDAIVVLGAAQYNGRPSNVLEARLDHALALYEEGYAPAIVVTGGSAPGDAFTEAEASAEYLVDRGVPESAILMENDGRDTWSSMQGVATVLEGTGSDRLLIVSDGFHLLRAELMARELGFEPFSSATPESPIRPWSGNEFAYAVRETGGIVAFLPEMIF